MSANDAPLIRLRGLRKEFNGTIAVANLNLDVFEGEFLCFLGPSGCGKTTTLRMIAGLEVPTAGDIFLRGERINDLPPQRRNVGFVFQNYALFWHMSVYDNLAFGLRVREVPPDEVDRRVREMARRLELDQVLDVRARRLDLSAMQRVALGRTLLTDPQVLLLDEPLNNFRPGLRELMRGELKRMQKQLGRTMIYVTHDQEEAMTMGDRVLVMNEGRVEQIGSPREVYHHPVSLFVASFIGRPMMNFIRTRYRVEGDRAFLEYQGLRWDVTNRRPQIEAAATDEIILGIRPEDIHLTDGSQPDTIQARVDLVQPLARNKIVDLEIEGMLIKVLVPSTTVIRAEDTVSVRFDPQKVHLFDSRTERTIG